ncbi:hypothetical protein WL19_16385 [Burkholderia ubonensis]|nr:hypothetical protein WL19_16385 [Burkholderia ubonensis]
MLMEIFSGASEFDPIATVVHAEFRAPVFDAELVDKLSIGNPDTPAQFRRSSPRVVFGIRNDTGDIYRRIGVYSTGVAFSLKNWFEAHGFVDEIGVTHIVVDGCDHIFRRHA